jgi:hypothetical protein
MWKVKTKKNIIEKTQKTLACQSPDLKLLSYQILMKFRFLFSLYR